MFTDTHSHIHFAQHFPDIENILDRSFAVDVTRQIIVGCTPKDSLEALKFVQKYSDRDFWSTLGVHPHNANECTPQILERFRQLVMTEKKIVALGEMGLDYFRNFQPRNIQQEAFRAQLELAKELDKAVVVHVREAWDDALRILGEAGNTRVVLHCFTGTLEQARSCWQKGYFTSFSGVVTYPKNEYLREVVRQAPAERMLIETDCPYLTPQAYRGQRNEPAYIIETAKELAHARGVSLEEIAQQTTQNSSVVFNLNS